jgi:hypothetical protein
MALFDLTQSFGHDRPFEALKVSSETIPTCGSPSSSAASPVKNNLHYHRMLALFLALWFTAGIVQCLLTELNGEECYYAEFAKHLAWGYFDHPPALAFFIRLGMLLFPGEFGARFMIPVLSTLTLWIGSKLLRPEQFPVYFAVACGVVLIETGSFFIKTDVPLVFFTTLFFYFLKRYLTGAEYAWAPPLAISIAGMFLSKYHGLLVVALAVISMPSLLKRGSFWLIALLTAILMLPHAAWLYSNGFVTVRYHLGGRSDAGFDWSHVLTYWLMEPLVLGPIIGFLLLPAALLARPRDAFERSLKFILIGILIFFFVASFFVRIHAHWTSIALIPILALAIPYICDRPRFRKVAVALAVLTAIGFLPVRLYLIWDFLPASIDQHIEICHGWRQWAQDIHRLACGRNVVFIDDYDTAAKFSYYTGEMAHSYNSYLFQFTQQDLWPLEEDFRGKPAMVIDANTPSTFFRTRNGASIKYCYVNDFQTHSKVDIALWCAERCIARLVSRSTCRLCYATATIIPSCSRTILNCLLESHGFFLQRDRMLLGRVRPLTTLRD